MQNRSHNNCPDKIAVFKSVPKMANTLLSGPKKAHPSSERRLLSILRKKVVQWFVAYLKN